MEQKFVSFKVAKVLKEAGYWNPGTIIKCSYNNGCYIDDGRFYENGCVCPWNKLYPAPTYLEVWLWLWRQKGITLEPSKEGILVLECEDENGQLYYSHNIYSQDENKDPEQAIANAIEYLAKNNLIK